MLRCEKGTRHFSLLQATVRQGNFYEINMAEAESDWDSVTYLRKKTPRAAELRSKQVT